MKKDKNNKNWDKRESVLEKLYSMHRFGMKPGLERIRRLLDKGGNPERKFKSVHVSGTNGKGSVSAMLASIMTEAGYRTGLYSSPHVVRFNERIQVDGEMIGDEDLAGLAEKYLPEDAGSEEATFFEITSAMAFDYFAGKNVDIAIIETGMGGRYDATNVLRPAVSVITSIGMDHREYLGDTLEEIAVEKAGIIKEGVPVAAYDNGSAVNEIIREQASKMKAPLRFASEYELPEIVKRTHGFNRVVKGKFAEEEFEAHFKLPGKHQIENLRLVLAAADVLRKDFSLRVPDVEAGIEYVKDNLFYRGRTDVISKSPLTILDGAHNRESIRALKETILSSKYKDKKFNILFAAMKDKDFKEMIVELMPIAESFIFTRPKIERAADGKMFEQVARENNLKFTYYEDVIDAYIYANKLKQPVIITGSFYLAGEVLNYLEN